MNETQKEKKWLALQRLQEQHPTAYFFLDLLANILIIVALVFAVRTYLISPFQVYGPSMCNTLNHINSECQEGFGEYLIVNKAVYHPFFGLRYTLPERGDIIVFRPPHNQEEFYIKRVIGLPGEKVKLQNGKVFIYNKDNQSGLELPEEYLSGDNKNQTFPIPSHVVTNYLVPEGNYFVLGDNRKKSTDSRSCFEGPLDQDCNGSNYFLPLSQIEGKAWIVLWPFNKLRLLGNPAY